MLRLEEARHAVEKHQFDKDLRTALRGVGDFKYSKISTEKYVNKLNKELTQRNVKKARVGEELIQVQKEFDFLKKKPSLQKLKRLRPLTKTGNLCRLLLATRLD